MDNKMCINTGPVWPPTNGAWIVGKSVSLVSNIDTGGRSHNCSEEALIWSTDATLPAGLRDWDRLWCEDHWQYGGVLEVKWIPIGQEPQVPRIPSYPSYGEATTSGNVTESVFHKAQETEPTVSISI